MYYTYPFIYKKKNIAPVLKLIIEVLKLNKY